MIIAAEYPSNDRPIWRMMFFPARLKQYVKCA